MIKIEQMNKNFKNIFHHDSEHVYFSPGRINLIGEHIDYNGGYVFPCAINLGIYASVASRNDKIFQFYSEKYSNNGIISINLDDLSYNSEHYWANYVIGVIKILIDNGYKIDHGLDLFIDSDLPDGAGLSSSASIELLMETILNDIFSLSISKIDMARFGQIMENKYIGVNCGIMDQFAISMGKKNNAVLLNSNTLDYEYVPINLDNFSIVIINTNKKRELINSKYNERCKECSQSLKLFQKKLDISTLCDLNCNQFELFDYLLNNNNLIKRSRHVIFENQRVLYAKKALDNNDLITFGHLLNSSHISLRYDYEVTGIELDTIVDSSWSQNGVIGARMCGAGFGGCAIAIVDHNKINNFCNNVGKKYLETIGYNASFYIVDISDGPKCLK